MVDKLSQPAATTDTATTPAASGTAAPQLDARSAALHRKIVQRKARAGGGGSAGGGSSGGASGGGGGEVPFRAEMERSFGQDFGPVRASVGQAGAMAALGAQAATTGEQISFADAAPSRELVAHELTHVVQQRAGAVAATQGKGAAIDPDASLEAEADRVGAQVASGGRAEVASAAMALSPSSPSSSSSSILRKPDVSKKIDWKSAKGAKRLGLHPVARVDLPSGPVVVKKQARATSASEAYVGKLAADMLPGATTANMRLLDEVEGKEADTVIRALVPKIDFPAEGGLMVMDYMEGEDLSDKEGKDLLKDKEGKVSDEGRARAGNVSELLAFNFFIEGADRFQVDDKKYGGNERNDNIRLDKNSDKVQAIDTTVRSRLKEDLPGGPKKAAADFQKFLEPLFDNLLYNRDGDSKLLRALEKQLGVGDLGKQGRTEMRAGFARALKSIGESTTDLQAALLNIDDHAVNELSQILSKGYPEFLEEMRGFFLRKAQLFARIEAVGGGSDKKTDSRGDLLTVVQAASRLEIGERIGDLKSFLKTYDRGPAGGKDAKAKRRPKWQGGLEAMQHDKDAAVNVLGMAKSTTKQAAAPVLRNLIATGSALLGVDDAADQLEDFCRLGAKIALRLDGKIGG